MTIQKRNKIDLPLDLHETINETIINSLLKVTTIDDKFIINDTLWYARNRKGSITPCVVNEAGYISKNFQQNLSKHKNWEGETKILSQNIDGYGELILNKNYYTYKLQEKYILPFLKKYLEINKYPKYLISKYFSMFYGMYIERNIFTLDSVPQNLHEYFEINKNDMKKTIRIGVEFETGNIASSFRAFSKLNSLFLMGAIDVGVFITSIDKKSSAAKIWPQSNRNGSFEELENRNYKDSVFVPIIEFGFAPDTFSKKSPYLKDDGTLYFPKKTNKKITYNDEEYHVYIGSNNDKILLKAAK